MAAVANRGKASKIIILCIGYIRMPVPKALQAWHEHLAAYRKANPGKSLKECMKGAKETYKKSS